MALGILDVSDTDEADDTIAFLPSAGTHSTHHVGK
jgi:hypothetical protein